MATRSDICLYFRSSFCRVIISAKLYSTKCETSVGRIRPPVLIWRTWPWTWQQGCATSVLHSVSKCWGNTYMYTFGFKVGTCKQRPDKSADSGRRNEVLKTVELNVKWHHSLFQSLDLGRFFFLHFHWCFASQSTVYRGHGSGGGRVVKLLACGVRFPVSPLEFIEIGYLLLPSRGYGWNTS